MSIFQDFEKIKKEIGNDKFDKIEEYLETKYTKKDIDKYFLELNKIWKYPPEEWNKKSNELKEKYNIIFIDDVIYNEKEWTKFDNWYNKNVGCIIDRNKVSGDLYNDEQKQNFEDKVIEDDGFYDDLPKRMQAKALPDNWIWVKYNDGSGYLESPEGKEYMSYDLNTNEYKETKNSEYQFFPLIYYYGDGYKLEEFEAFEWMEKYIKEKYIEKNNLEL